MYKILENKSGVKKLKRTSFSGLGMKERQNLQEWIFESPEILGEEDQLLLMIAKELPVNDISKSIRLDLLAIDRSGSLVVIEIKRDDTRGDIDWQAIKYASRCSNLDGEDILALYCDPKYNLKPKSRSEAISEILEHINADVPSNPAEAESRFFEAFRKSESGKLSVRILLVAQDFHPDICAAVLWLRDSGIDIGCIRLSPYIDEEQQSAYIDVERIIPIPETQEYTEHFIKKKRGIEKSGVGDSERNSVFGLDQIDEISDDELRIKLRDLFERKTNLSPRLIRFFEILSGAEESCYVNRIEIVRNFSEQKPLLAMDVGHAGRLLSNVSQFITKKGNAFLRTIVEYETVSGVDLPGQRKEKFRIKEKYKSVVTEVLKELEPKA